MVTKAMKDNGLSGGEGGQRMTALAMSSDGKLLIAGTAGEILDLSTVEEFEAISGWANKTVFTWDGIATLNPIRGKCVLKDL